MRRTLADFLGRAGKWHGGGDFGAEIFGAGEQKLLDVDFF
jgi:hypothetical protein